MTNYEDGSLDALRDYLASSEDARFAFERVTDSMANAAEIRRQAGTEGLSAELSGNIDGIPYSVYLGPEDKEE